MKSMRPIYRPISQWKILEIHTVNDFTNDSPLFEAVEVEIGTLYTDSININNSVVSTTTPIIRWISCDQLKRLNQYEGMVIW